jgi:hypothetical protein
VGEWNKKLIAEGKLRPLPEQMVQIPGGPLW